MRVLNLYAGIGGNRKLWKGCEVTAVEKSPEIAAVYKRNFPKDIVVIGDAHQYLLDHYRDFDFIWSSPPCQSHSKMVKATRHDVRRYPEMELYQEIIFLKHFSDRRFWVVENVDPYYRPLIPPTKKVGRHLFWANFPFTLENIPKLPNFINLDTKAGKQVLMDWIGIHYEENLFYGNNYCPNQVLRNCVHPEIGRQVFEGAFKRKIKTEKAAEGFGL